MSFHYYLSVELELVMEITKEELDMVYWVFGLGKQPTSMSDAVVPQLIEPEPINSEWLRFPGGANAQIRYSRRPAIRGNTPSGWSAAGRDCMLDDGFYHDGIDAIAWLATVSATEGLIATAREESELIPSWLFYSFNRLPYQLYKGEIKPLTADAPDVPQVVKEALQQELMKLNFLHT